MDHSVMTSRKVLPMIVLLALSTNGLMGQEEIPRATVSVRSGYTTFDFSELNKVMEDAAAYYRTKGIPLKVQTFHPGNAFIGGEFRINRKDIRVGFGMYYTNTMGFAGYRDGAGTLKVRSSAGFLAAQVIGGLNLSQWQGGDLYIAGKFGMLFGDWKLSEEVMFEDFPSYSGTTETEASAEGFFLEAVVGLRYGLFEWISAEVETGYRFGGVHDLLINGQEAGIGFEPSGFVLGIGVEVELSR